MQKKPTLIATAMVFTSAQGKKVQSPMCVGQRVTPCDVKDFKSATWRTTVLRKCHPSFISFPVKMAIKYYVIHFQHHEKSRKHTFNRE